MNSAKNAGRKRLGRLPIVGGNATSSHDIKRSCQIESRDHHGSVQKSKSRSSESGCVDLSFSASFACDLEGDLDLMSALDKMENDYKPTRPEESKSASIERNKRVVTGSTNKEKRIPSSKKYSNKGKTESFIEIVPKQANKVNVCNKRNHGDLTTYKENLPVKTKSQRKRSLTKSPAFFQDDSLWTSPIGMSTPHNPHLAITNKSLLNSSGRRSITNSTSQKCKGSSRTATDKKTESKIMKTPENITTRTTRSSSKRKSQNEIKQKKVVDGLDCKDTPVRGNVCDKNNRSDFFKSLFVDSTSFNDLSSHETDPGKQAKRVVHDNPKRENKLNNLSRNKLLHDDQGHILEEEKGAAQVSSKPAQHGRQTVRDTDVKIPQPKDDDLHCRTKSQDADDVNDKVTTKRTGSNDFVVEAGPSMSNEGSVKIQPGSSIDQLALSSWGLPDPILKQYHQRGITHMFEWQAECLLQGNVLGGGNLVYSAPTSAGKTMVAELLVLKRVLETRKKAIIILPFVSVTREKMFYLQELYQDAGIRVSGFMGSYAPAGGFSKVDVAVCTIEKGNGIINRCLEDNRLDELGIIVVDELHLIGDPHRGYLLELLLTKIAYMVKKSQQTDQRDLAPLSIQIVGMSATLPNLDLLARWIDADLYRTDYRPVPLTECVKIGTALYDNNMALIRDIDTTYTVKGDTDHVVPLCIETVRGSHSVLIFCPTKNWCEKLAETVAKEFYNLLRNPAIAVTSNQGFSKASDLLVIPLVQTALRDIVEQLKRTPVGVDAVLGRTVPLGVAYHHAGLTFDERDIIEGAFRQGILKVLIATSTLSSGVNLPARRVLIRTPTFHGQLIDFLTYKQMIGRAGRKGVDTAGESILLCKPSERAKAAKLVGGALPPVQSTLIRNQGEELSSSMKRAILEVVVSGVAMAPSDVASYASCTLLAASLPADSGQTDQLIQQCIKFLQENEFVCSQTVTDSRGQQTERFVPTQLGAAVLASSLSPDEGLLVFSELQRARKCFVLENELHIIYQVTPIYAMGIGDSIDWYQFFCIWEALSPGMKKVAELAGVKESFLARAVQGRIPTKTAAQVQLLRIHRRFYTALALHDLVQEVPLNVVAQKYNCNKGQLQSLQQSAATFAGMVTVFCARLGWSNLELILSQFQNRLTFGVQRELCDLVRISSLNGQRARVMFNGGYQTVAALASAQPADVEALLKNSAPFQSMKRQEKESDWEVQERCKARCIFLTGRKGVTEFDAALAIIDEAKSIIQDELGGLGIQWKTSEDRASTSEPKYKSPVLTSPVPGGPQRNKSLLGKRRSRSSGGLDRNAEQRPCVPCVISPPPPEKQSKTCTSEASHVMKPAHMLQNSTKQPVDTPSLPRPNQSSEVCSEQPDITREPQPSGPCAKNSKALTNEVHANKAGTNRQLDERSKVMSSRKQSVTTQAQIHTVESTGNVHESFNRNKACDKVMTISDKTLNTNDKLDKNTDTHTAGISISSVTGNNVKESDVAVKGTNSSNWATRNSQKDVSVDGPQRNSRQSFLEKMSSLKESISGGTASKSFKQGAECGITAEQFSKSSNVKSNRTSGNHMEIMKELPTSVGPDEILRADSNNSHALSVSDKLSKQKNVKFSARPLESIHTPSIDHGKKQKKAIVTENNNAHDDVETPILEDGTKIIKDNLVDEHLKGENKVTYSKQIRNSGRKSESKFEKPLDGCVSGKSVTDKASKPSQLLSSDGKNVITDDDFADSFVIDTQTAEEFTTIPMKSSLQLQTSAKRKVIARIFSTSKLNSEQINTEQTIDLVSKNDSANEQGAFDDVMDNTLDLNGHKSIIAKKCNRKICDSVSVMSQNDDNCDQNIERTNTVLDNEVDNGNENNNNVSENMSELSADSACNELDMNIADRSDVDMFDKSEELIAASHYEHLSGESRTQALANDSYQDLHIPYQSGQERCFEGADKDHPVMNNVRPAVVNYNEVNCLVNKQNLNNGGTLGQFSSQRPKSVSNYSKLHEDLAIALEMGDSFTNTFSEAGTKDIIKNDNDKPEATNTSKADDENIGDSWTFSMMEHVLDDSENKKAKLKEVNCDIDGFNSKQSCDTVNLPEGESEQCSKETIKCDEVKSTNDDFKKLGDLESRSKGSTALYQCDTMSTSVLNSLNDDTFGTPVRGTNKRLRETPGSRKQKIQKTDNDADRTEKHTIENESIKNNSKVDYKRTKEKCSSHRKAIKNKGKGKRKSLAKEEDLSSPGHNTSTGSDCVPPTPPGDESVLNSPQGQPGTSKRTPRSVLKRSTTFSPRLKAAAGFSPRLKAAESLRKYKESIAEAGRVNGDSGSEHVNKQNANEHVNKKVSKTNQPTIGCMTHLNEGNKKVCSKTDKKSGNIKDDDEKEIDKQVRLTEDDMDDIFDKDMEQVDNNEDDDDRLCPSFIDPDESGLSLTQASFTIIDVCADKRLFKTFILEWRTKTRYAVSLACERKQTLPITGGIGANFRKDYSPSKQAAEVGGIPVDSEGLLIVGVAISWDNRDAYYVSFTHDVPHGDPDDSLAPPPSDEHISISIRLKAVKSVLQQSHCKGDAVTMVMFDVKSHYRAFAESCGFVPNGHFEDPKIACWMLDPGAREKNLHRMVTNLLPTEVHLLHGIGGGIGVSSLGMSPQNPGSGRYRATTECVLVRHLGEYFQRCLEKEGLYSVFTDVEMPSAITLCRMELTGFGFSQEESENQKGIMIAKLSALEEQAYSMAGHPFSLSATEDVAQVLFVELLLPPNGDTTSGPVTRSLAPNTRRGRQKNLYSTSKDVLEKLKKLHPLPGVILEWRRITNALTKVVFPLQKEKVLCDRLSMCRIYSDCQLHTATGRVSLSEPNLQNVPKDFEIIMPDLIGESPPPNTTDTRTRKSRGGSSKLRQMIGPHQVAMVTEDNSGTKFSVSMRHAFIPFPGGVLVAADYSQLELRMIAYLSDDQKLIQTLNEDGDVFKLITAQWKNIKPEEVTAEERQQAKQVCYGMIYGIGAKALGEQLEVEENDAAVFIESFKAKYPAMRTYLRKTVESCREKGYVQTMLGRKRYLPQITGTNPHARAQAERQAVNTTVQGSAADLVKMATIKIDQKLAQMFPMTVFTHKHKLNNRQLGTLTTPPEGGFLVLQLHDELIYEVSAAHVTQVANIVKETMETAVKLPVKMPVKVKTGASWGTLTEFEL